MAALAPLDLGTRVSVRPFDDRFLERIIGWVHTPADLKWLAPSTAWPLTVDKVRAWRRELGHAYGLHTGRTASPIGYGELNPMRSRPDQLWIGHVIVSPDHQGQGQGCRFSVELARLAFTTHKATCLILVVFPDNTQAISCYHRAGFRTVGEEYHAFGDDPKRHRLLRLEMTARDLIRA